MISFAKTRTCLGLTPVVAPLVMLLGCGGGGNDAILQPPPADPFAAVAQRLDAAAASDAPADLTGFGLAVIDRSGQVVFERRYGDFDPEQPYAVASASKLVTSLVLLRLVDQGFLSLDDTTAAVLGWSGPQGEITLRHLLSFTSGLPPTVSCAMVSEDTLAGCVAQIELLDPVASPGQRFDYGNTHMHVAARMAEAVTGSPWNTLVEAQLRQPLGLPGPLTYYTFPRARLGTSNPLAAGGLVTRLPDYAVLMGLVLNDGEHQGNPLIDAALIEAISVEPYPGATVGEVPAVIAQLGFRYGLGAWLECATPAAGCAVVSSPGLFGWTPWVDREAGYIAILGMEGIPSGDLVPFAVMLAQDLQPLIRDAL
jgi:serine-type D-Ala-D-Ala carboxypeptidase/endopeptidase